MIRPLIFAAVLLVVACATAYTLPPQDRAAIAARIAGFERSFVSGDTAGVIDVVPPRIISAIAQENGVSVNDLRRDMITLTREATRDVKVVSFGMALDRATFRTTPSGRPYGLIPTQTVVQSKGGVDLQSNTSTLTLEDGGTWHLIRIDDARQVNLMRRVYPDFQDVQFPACSTSTTG
jgi:hypothetical protein